MEGCPGVLATRSAMQVHFVHRHVHDTVVTKVDKTVSMACQPCRAGSGNRTTDRYRRRVTGEGLYYQER